MLKEEGKVKIIDEKYAFVAAKEGYACLTCPLIGACKALGVEGEMVIKAINYVGAKVGDKVIVAVGSNMFFKAAALIYLLPVVAFIIGAVIGGSVAPHLDLNVSAEAVSVIFGLVYLIASLFIVKLFIRKIVESDTDRARVIKVLNA